VIYLPGLSEPWLHVVLGNPFKYLARAHHELALLLPLRLHLVALDLFQGPGEGLISGFRRCPLALCLDPESESGLFGAFDVRLPSEGALEEDDQTIPLVAVKLHGNPGLLLTASGLHEVFSLAHKGSSLFQCLKSCQIVLNSEILGGLVGDLL
jgi:hypothetical protein